MKNEEESLPPRAVSESIYSALAGQLDGFQSFPEITNYFAWTRLLSPPGAGGEAQ